MAKINLTDGIMVLSFLFLGREEPKCKDAADFNNDSTVNLTDGIAIFNYLFLGGSPPATPGPIGEPCGVDLDPVKSADALDCAEYTHCE